ncbi:uncharacterized protein V2V93DRAFT_389093 [Kockiozyma suomiensis]|uniref:uncharacterized protein n=1 Tax=Kockiozyma suomiensis TaxID=1337062 RepID=UPI0033438890
MRLVQLHSSTLSKVYIRPGYAHFLIPTSLRSDVHRQATLSFRNLKLYTTESTSIKDDASQIPKVASGSGSHKPERPRSPLVSFYISFFIPIAKVLVVVGATFYFLSFLKYTLQKSEEKSNENDSKN